MMHVCAQHFDFERQSLQALCICWHELVRALEDPAVYEPGGRAVSINRELSSVINRLAQLTAEWENVTTVA